MLRIVTLCLASAIVFAGSTVRAQDPPLEKAPAQTDANSSGTSPGGMGSTGWTGGTGGAHIGTSNSHTTGAASPPAPAENQPTMATGSDLNGPPTRFPANRTPE